jgi:hypothetical protein
MLDWEALAKTRIIDGAAQERSFPCGVLRHVVTIDRHQLRMERLADARDFRVLGQPVAEQSLVLERPGWADGQMEMESGGRGVASLGKKRICPHGRLRNRPDKAFASAQRTPLTASL